MDSCVPDGVTNLSSWGSLVGPPIPKRSKSRVTPWSSRLGVERRANDPAP